MDIEKIQYEFGQEQETPSSQTKVVVISHSPKLFGISIWIWILILLVLILIVLILR
ncbi:hypothetical protein STIV2_A55 [Sulfolobus turreted icosahedral virus 2]|uniref:Uncharacterized protein n=1 Tax=Sulfolobus turreted icosahedral virus 2 TaxID=754004 RepID=D5IEX2_9VIRU|nr:hypothetical protein STIV2_A55 [Sulfolobus turreted icosahedral virus 2]ADF27747.1 hypothetical protein STIV2_A55 [Sulfolobus turreted icosahedral virus 2]